MNSLSMYRVRVRTLVREHPEPVGSEKDLRDYYRRVSSRKNLKRLGISPWFVVGGVPLAMFVSGLILNHTGSDHALVSFPALAVIWVDMFILLFLMFWGEKRLLDTLTEIRPAFAFKDREYYRFVGRFLQRLYEPSPFADRDDEIRFHLMSVTTYCLTFMLLLVLATRLPEQLVVVDGSGPSIALQAYVVLTIAFVNFGLCQGFWTTGCLVWFMGIRAIDKPIRISAARSVDNLGLRPYGEFILHAALIGFSGILVSGLGYLASPHPLLMVVTVLGSVLLIAWYIGAQYGLHKSMVQAKRERLKQLNETYVNFADHCFDTTAETSAEFINETRSLLDLKREIEKLPTWPGKTVEFAQIASAAVVSHIPFYLQFFNVV